MKSAILALDQGTTSARAIVFDRAGSIRAVAQKEFRQIYPRPGWVEHDPMEIWSAQLETARAALAQAGLKATDLAAIGITNQRETTVVWDRATGQPIYNAIVWQDRRTADWCEQLKRHGAEPLIQAKTGLVIDPYFSGTKLRWVLDHVPGARGRAQRGELAFGTIDSWLVWQLSGGQLHLTDASNASRTLLFNLRTGGWDPELLALLAVPAEVLPQVRPSSAVYGYSVSAVLGEPVPLAGIAGDQQAALFGQACFAPGLAKNTYGTGCFVLMNLGQQPVPSRHRLLTTVAWRLGEQTTYALEGSVFIGGAVVQWLRDGLGLIRSSAEIEALAASVPDTGGVYCVPAFAGLGAPHWDPYARGLIIGLTRGTTAGHLARAALESIAFQVADIVEVMRRDAGVALSQLRVDGGAAANNLLLQMQADLLQVPVVRPKVTETTALGAAYLAGLATGFWKDRAELEQAWQIDRVFEPRLAPEAAAERRARWAEALRRARGWETPGNPAPGHSV
jgi:glycerol kinase